MIRLLDENPHWALLLFAAVLLAAAIFATS
jgi:hypothetical protein